MQGMFDVGLSVWVKMRPTTASAAFYFQGHSFDFVGVLCTCFGLGFWHLGFWLWAFGRFSNDQIIWFVFSVSSIHFHFTSSCLKNKICFEGGFGSSCSLCLLIITDSSAWSA